MKNCSHAPEVNDPPTVLVQQAAQNIYNNPCQASDIAGELHGTLVAHYKDIGMSERLPDKARYLELRGPWNALLAPILHGIEVEIVKELLPQMREAPHLQDGLSDAVLSSPALSVFAESTAVDMRFSQSYEHLSLAAMRTVMGWTTTVAEWFLEDMQTEYDHWCRPVFEAFSDFHSLFRHPESIHKNGWKRKKLPAAAIMEAVEDSNETAYGVIRPFLNQYVDIANKKQLLIAKNEELGWASSVSREYLGKYLGRSSRVPIGNPFVSLEELLEQQTIWCLSSLKDGPWTVPRYCPAGVILRSPFLDARTAIDKFGRGIEYHAAREWGSASASELRLNMLSRIIGDTLLVQTN